MSRNDTPSQTSTYVSLATLRSIRDSNLASIVGRNNQGTHPFQMRSTIIISSETIPDKAKGEEQVAIVELDNTVLRHDHDSASWVSEGILNEEGMKAIKVALDGSAVSAASPEYIKQFKLDAALASLISQSTTTAGGAKAESGGEQTWSREGFTHSTEGAPIFVLTSEGEYEKVQKPEKTYIRFKYPYTKPFSTAERATRAQVSNMTDADIDINPAAALTLPLRLTPLLTHSRRQTGGASPILARCAAKPSISKTPTGFKWRFTEFSSSIGCGSGGFLPLQDVSKSDELAASSWQDHLAISPLCLNATTIGGIKSMFNQAGPHAQQEGQLQNSKDGGVFRDLEADTKSSFLILSPVIAPQEK